MATLGATPSALYSTLKALRDQLVALPAAWQGKFLQVTPWTEADGTVHNPAAPEAWGSNVMLWPLPTAGVYTAAWNDYVALMKPPGTEKLNPLTRKPAEALYNVNYALWRLQPASTQPPVKPMSVRMAGLPMGWALLLAFGGAFAARKYLSRNLKPARKRRPVRRRKGRR
jgi:hypothetical protein